MKTYQTRNRLTALLYILLRDHVTPGKLEALVTDLEVNVPNSYILSNNYLGEYAEELAARIEGEVR